MRSIFGIITAVLFLMRAAAGGGAEGGAGSGAEGGKKIIIPRTEGRLTITGLEEYEDCYVIAEGYTENDLELIIAQDINFQSEKIYGGSISNGSVTLNVWSIIDPGKIQSYNENNENAIISLMIVRSSSFTESTDENDFIGSGTIYSVEFRNGIASAECGKIEEERNC